jgi:hypothetical protein
MVLRLPSFLLKNRSSRAPKIQSWERQSLVAVEVVVVLRFHGVSIASLGWTRS